MPNTNVPSDINANWLRIARSMEAASHKYPSGGFSVVNLAVLVDSKGAPVFWSTPQVTFIEPQNSQNVLHYLTAALRLTPMPAPKPSSDT